MSLEKFEKLWTLISTTATKYIETLRGTPFHEWEERIKELPYELPEHVTDNKSFGYVVETFMKEHAEPDITKLLLGMGDVRLTNSDLLGNMKEMEAPPNDFQLAMA